MCRRRPSRALWRVSDGVTRGDRWLLALYQLATWVSFSVLDDAAMLAFAFS